MMLINRKMQSRKATAAVELAVTLPFLLIVIAGVWEVGRMVQAQQLLANAAREGGRQAAAGLTDATAVRQFVVNYLTVNGLSNVTISNVTFSNITNPSNTDPRTANQFDQFRVTVTVPYSSIQWSTMAQITSTSSITASADWYSMRDVPLDITTTIPTN